MRIVTDRCLPAIHNVASKTPAKPPIVTDRCLPAIHNQTDLDDRLGEL